MSSHDSGSIVESISSIESKTSKRKSVPKSTKSDEKQDNLFGKEPVLDEVSSVENYLIEEGDGGEGFYDEIGGEEEDIFISVFDVLDAPRELPEPIELTQQHLKQVANELGLIRLCWPDVIEPSFEGRTHFPKSYLSNTNKEKLLLLYAENFRRQFYHKYPNRKPLFSAADNECGQQKMVCTTLRPTILPHTEIEQWQNCASFVGDHLIYEPLEAPTLIPDRLYSPHTVFLRKSGQSFEIATALCSLLIGLNYDAYVVSGYAVRDITLKIMTRVASPFPEDGDKEDEKEEEVIDPKYVLKPPRDLRSKFLLAMEQREIDKVNDEKKRIEEEKRKEIEELEKPPFDELHGLRIHAWVLIRPGKRDIEEPFFIESCSGYKHAIDSDFYCGVESVWNHENYWVNLQDCSEGISKLDYDFTNVTNWEHLLAGEPIRWRQTKRDEDMDDDEIALNEIFQEKHLDMPYPWSQLISIPHDVIQKRFPTGVRHTSYMRTLVEEYAPYVQEDGLVVRICRFGDLDCSPDTMYVVEERYENRHDHMTKVIMEMESGLVTEYFGIGREDAAKVHYYYADENKVEAKRTIEFYHESRFDSMSKLELDAEWMIEHYIGREDFFSYRKVNYAKRGHPPPGILEGPRRIVLNLLEQFERDYSKKASDDIASREFAIIKKEIHLKFQYDKGKVTASTRDFIKPPMSEMGDRLTFNPELTSGYQAEIGAKPPRQLNLYNLLESQIKKEEESLREIREIDDQVAEFVRLRDLERALPKLDVSIFNREMNIEYRTGMLEREEQQKESREREVEEETDFLSPYLAKLNFPKTLNMNQALQARNQCLYDFKQLLVKRANDIQKQFENVTLHMQENQIWYTSVLDTLTLLEEESYFKEVNDNKFHLHTLEIRLARQRELAPSRYESLVNYLRTHPELQILYKR